MLKEHRGVPCDEKTGKEHVDCKAHEKEVEKDKNKRRKLKRTIMQGGDEIMALSKAKMEEPPLKVRKRHKKPAGSKAFEKLAQGDVGLTEKTKKNKKPHCQPRGKWHDENGRFSSKANATSWSGSNPEGKSNCSYGWNQSKGGGERLATKLPCGRAGGAGGKPDPDKKAPWKCKNKERYWIEHINELLIEEEPEAVQRS